MNAVEMIELYGNLFYVSLMVALVGLALAAFFFFYFDIPTVYAQTSGKAKRETIRRMNEQNARTGNLRNQYMHTGPTGRTGKTKDSGGMTENVSQHQVQQPQAANQDAQERYETSVLQTQAQETTILSAAAPETQVLGYGSADAGETAMLSSSDPYAAQSAAPVQMPGFRFDVTDNTLVIHTNEII